MDAYNIDPEYIAGLMENELEFLKFSLKWLRFAMFDEGDFKVNMESEKERRKNCWLNEKNREKRRQQKSNSFPCAEQKTQGA